MQITQENLDLKSLNRQLNKKTILSYIPEFFFIIGLMFYFLIRGVFIWFIVFGITIILFLLTRNARKDAKEILRQIKDLEKKKVQEKLGLS